MRNKIPASQYCESVFDGTHDTPKPVTAGYPLVTSKNILGGELNLSDAYNISKEDYTAIQKRSAVSQWDVLFSMIGSVGEVYLEKSSSIPYAIKNIGVFSCKNEYKAKWLYYYLLSPWARKYTSNYLNGAVQKFLPLGALRDFPVTPYDTSKKYLVDLLQTLDTKIEVNNKINLELDTLTKTIYNYWFVQFDFPDDNGKPYKSSGGKMIKDKGISREIPKGWENTELSNIANITMGQSPAGESFNEDHDGMIFFQGSTDFGNRFPIVRQYTTSPTRFAKHGDILLSVRAPVGAINIADNDCCIGRGLAALNSKDGNIEYLFEVVKDLKQIFDRRNVNGTTFGSITKDDLFSLNVIKPSKKILDNYHELIKPIFEKQNEIAMENQNLTELRDWLLPMLMNGQVVSKQDLKTVKVS